MADPPLPPQARSSDPPRSSPPPRACLGATFFSRASATSGKAPTCAGISRRLSEDTSLEAASLPPEVAPDGDFSFCCLGLASYRQGQVPEKAASVTSGAPSTSATEAVLPQCMGVQIIRAQAPLPPVPPAMAAARGEDASPGAAAPRPPARVGAPPPPSSRSTPPLPARGYVLAAVPDLAAKMGRSAKKVADKMASNAAIVGVAARQAAEDMVGGFLPGSERGRGK